LIKRAREREERNRENLKERVENSVKKRRENNIPKLVINRVFPYVAISYSYV